MSRNSREAQDLSLHHAVEAGDLAEVSRLIAQKIDVNSVDETGATPLLIATKKDPSDAIDEIIMELMVANADVTIADKNGVTPIICASASGHTGVIYALTQEGAKVNKADNNDNTPLFAAILGGHAATVQVLIACHADLAIIDRRGFTPLYVAMSEGGEHSALMVDALVKRILEVGGLSGTELEDLVMTAILNQNFVSAAVLFKYSIGRLEKVGEALEGREALLALKGKTVSDESKDMAIALGIAPRFFPDFKGAAEAISKIREDGLNLIGRSINNAFKTCYARESLVDPVSLIECALNEGASIDQICYKEGATEMNAVRFSCFLATEVAIGIVDYISKPGHDLPQQKKRVNSKFEYLRKTLDTVLNLFRKKEEFASLLRAIPKEEREGFENSFSQIKEFLGAKDTPAAEVKEAGSERLQSSDAYRRQ